MSVVNPALMTTANINTSRIVRDVSPAIGFLAPTRAQLLFLSSKVHPAPLQHVHGYPEAGAHPVQLGVRTTTQWTYEWMEDALKSTTTQINNGGGYVAGDTSIIVDDASIFSVNDLVDVVSTGEILLVTAVNVSTNTLTVTRSWGSTAAASIADNAYVLIVGNAYSEASNYNLAPNRNTTFVSNYIQDTRHSFAGSYHLDRHELYGGNQRAYMRNKFLADHMQYIEASLLFGEKVAGTDAAGFPKKTCGGLLEFQAGNNVTAIGGTLTKSAWHTALSGLFTNGKPEKVVIASPLVANAISNFAADDSSAPKSQMWIMNNARQFGLNVMTYTTKFGTIHLIMHGMLNGNTYNGYALGLDLDNIQLVKVRGGFFMHLREDIVQDGAHRWVDEYATYFGLEYKNPETGMLLTGITG